jgi:hypothetical protein
LNIFREYEKKERARFETKTIKKKEGGKTAPARFEKKTIILQNCKNLPQVHPTGLHHLSAID